MMDMDLALKIAVLQSNADYWESQSKFILAAMGVDDIIFNAILEQYLNEGIL